MTESQSCVVKRLAKFVFLLLTKKAYLTKGICMTYTMTCVNSQESCAILLTLWYIVLMFFVCMLVNIICSSHMCMLGNGHAVPYAE